MNDKRITLKLFRSDQVRVGLSLTEAKALLGQLTAAVEDCEFMRPEKGVRKKAKSRTRKSTVRLRRP